MSIDPISKVRQVETIESAPLSYMLDGLKKKKDCGIAAEWQSEGASQSQGM